MANPISPEKRAAVAADLKAGQSRQIVAEKHSLSYPTVARIDREQLAGITRSGSTRHKLTAEQRAAVALDYREGLLSNPEIAKKHGISPSTVTSIAKAAGIVRAGGRRGSESPVELVAGAWVYDAKGVAHWTPGAVAPIYDEGGAA